MSPHQTVEMVGVETCSGSLSTSLLYRVGYCSSLFSSLVSSCAVAHVKGKTPFLKHKTCSDGAVQ